jgi:predicted nucleic-acid-binding Zn-ribbon protein
VKGVDGIGTENAIILHSKQIKGINALRKGGDLMEGFTIKTKCPKCGSEDCNDSGYFDHEFAGFKLTGKVLFCNHCGYERKELKLAGTPKIIASSEIIP